MVGTYSIVKKRVVFEVFENTGSPNEAFAK